MSGSAFNYNVASGAFLPNQGMSFNGAESKRLYDWQAFQAKRSGTARPAAETPAASVAPDIGAAPGTQPAATGNPAAPGNVPLNKSTNLRPGSTIAGGALRPGSIDQNQFKALLAAASGPGGAAVTPNIAGTERSANLQPELGRLLSPIPAVTGRSPLAPAGILAAQQLASRDPSPQPAPAADGIPTLTAAQFAALTGSPVTAEGSAAEKNAAADSARPSGTLSIPPVVVPAENEAGPGIPADALTMSDDAIPPDGPSKPADPQKDDDGVLKLTRIPDRETRQEYAAKGIKWKLVDDPEADRLFFGEDGKFGWDDLVDLINPLQHIPGINVIYRELTGDQIHGAAELLGAIPFGPASTLSAIANIAVKSTSGKDIGGNVLAMIMGEDDKVPAKDLASRAGTAPENASASSDLTQAAMPAQQAAVPRNWNNGRGRDEAA